MDMDPVRDAKGNPVTRGKVCSCIRFDDFYIDALFQHKLVDIVVARERDVGQNDTQYVTRTHLGNILQIGDLVLGWVQTQLNCSHEIAPC